jgi:hypothetical protein
MLEAILWNIGRGKGWEKRSISQIRTSEGKARELMTEAMVVQCDKEILEVISAK